MAHDSLLDHYDREILEILSRDGRITVTGLAQRVGLSKTPCQKRLRRLEAEGFIQGYRAILDPDRLDAAHIVFVTVKLANTTAPALADFNRRVREIRQIEQCHMIAGGFDYLLKVRTRDIADYRRVLADRISTLPHVAHTSTYVSMQSIRDTSF